MTFREDFLELMYRFDRMLVQVQVICVILLLLLAFSWVVARPEPGTETYWIILLDLVIVGIPFVGVTLLRRASAKQDQALQAGPGG
jgi:general stress protein CsbA